MKYQSKPVTIDAMHYTGDNLTEIYKWAESLLSVHDPEHPDIYETGAPHHTTIKVLSLQGYVDAVKGDWLIIPAGKNEIYPCNPKVFEERYTIAP